MGESLTQQRRVSDDAFWSVKLCQKGITGYLLIISILDGTFRGSPG